MNEGIREAVLAVIMSMVAPVSEPVDLELEPFIARLEEIAEPGGMVEPICRVELCDMPPAATHD